jgi:hypothetical protein
MQPPSIDTNRFPMHDEQARDGELNIWAASSQSG